MHHTCTTFEKTGAGIFQGKVNKHLLLRSTMDKNQLH